MVDEFPSIHGRFHDGAGHCLDGIHCYGHHGWVVGDLLKIAVNSLYHGILLGIWNACRGEAQGVHYGYLVVPWGQVGQVDLEQYQRQRL
jgi:hypothetical protein